MAPVAEGFNWAGYLLPGAVLLTAGTILAAVLLRRHRMALATPAPAPAPSQAGPGAPVSLPGVTPEELARLEAELQEVDR